MKKLSILLVLLVFFLVGCTDFPTTISSGETLLLSGDDIVEIPESIDPIKEKIESMSLKEKIAQMLIVDYSYVAYAKEDLGNDVTFLSDEAKKIISKYNFGGIILFRDNITGTEQTYNLIKSMQESATSNDSTNQIPLFIAVDQEGGRIVRLKTGTSMPGNMALGAINDYETTKNTASIIAQELKALGFNIDFAPVVDVNSNVNNPIIGLRSFSSDPNIVANMGKAYVSGLQENSIISCLKHFPGHGDTATDSHTGLPLIDKSYDQLKECELIPFKECIDNGADMIMTAHIVYPQIEKATYKSKSTGEEIYLPATLSKTILTDILRNDLGFDGIIVTDALNMAAISENFDPKDSAKLIINAGADIILMPVSLGHGEQAIDTYISNIETMVENGEISEDRINESVFRILALKYKIGLFEDNKEVINPKEIVGSLKNHEYELEVSNKSITLIKNEDVIPVDKSEKVLILNGYDNELNSMKYAIDRLKNDGILDEDFDYEVITYKGKTDSIKQLIANSSIIIATVNSTNKTFLNPTNEKNGWQCSFVDSLIKEAHHQNKKVIIVSSNLPYDIARYLEADAILCCYGDKEIPNYPIIYDGETTTFNTNMTSAIIKIFDKKEFTGSLPVTVYKLNESFDYTNEVLFDVGYKLNK